MRVPNLLATRNGRLAAFFALYITEGIPLGFTAVVIATQLRRQGVEPGRIGELIAALYLPWAWKWALGPLVDTLRWDRLGPRRVWIVGAQLGMVLSLIAMMPVDFTEEMGLGIALVVVHNLFGATQDVAIDALAVNSLAERDRGVANGLMFAGAYLGQTIGGAGVLWLLPYVGFQGAFLVVAGCVLSVTLLVSLPLREVVPPRPPPDRTSALPRVAHELRTFVRDSARAMFGTRAAIAALGVALLPAGAQALSLSLSSTLSVELGMSDGDIGTLSFWSTILAALGCVAGGFVSDRFGRRKTLAVFLVGTALPTGWLAYEMAVAGWIFPVPLDALDRPAVPAGLVAAFWGASLVFSSFTGLMYGIRTALYMDVTVAAVAATQFTAYMAVLNVVTSYTAWWQGHAVERWGYPTTLGIDATVGLVGIALLPFTIPKAPVPGR